MTTTEMVGGMEVMTPSRCLSSESGRGIPITGAGHTDESAFTVSQALASGRGRLQTGRRDAPSVKDRLYWLAALWPPPFGALPVPPRNGLVRHAQGRPPRRLARLASGGVVLQ